MDSDGKAGPHNKGEITFREVHGKILSLPARWPFLDFWEVDPKIGLQKLLVQGAEERCLPETYQKRLKDTPTFHPGQSTRRKIGKWTFELVWIRVSIWIQRGIVRFKDQQGDVPPWFLIIFDCLLWLMWVYHDWIHSVLWGRGDGL